MLDLTTRKFDPATACLAATNPKEFGANVLGISQMTKSTMDDFVASQPCEALDFMEMVKDAAIVLRSQLAMLETVIARVQPVIERVGWTESALSMATLEKISAASGVPIPEEITRPAWTERGGA